MTAYSSTQRPATFTDRRAHARRDCSFAGEIKISGEPAIACEVINVSEMGALLRFDMVIGLPPAFRLVIASEMFEADCEVRHQSGTNVGVMFTSNRLEAMARFG